MTVHPTAKCCWCQAGLVQSEVAGLTCWLCPEEACWRRQVAQAVVVTLKGKEKKCLFVPVPKQVVMWECPARNILWGGAAGPGKSTGCRWWLYKQCLTIPGYEALLLRENYKQLQQTHIRRMETESRLIGAEWIKSDGVLRFPNGSLIQCGHMEDAEAVQNYLSTEYDAIVPDEGSQYPVKDDGTVPLLELSTRARSNKPAVRAVGGAKFLVPSNPGGPSSNALLDVFVDHAPDFELYPALKAVYDPANFAYIPATLDDNPYIDPDYLTTLALLPKWRYEQLRHGDWRVFAGQFFSQWRESHHVDDLGLPDGVRWFRSLDWGRNQPGCALWWAILPDGRLYLRGELKFQGLDEQEVATRIHAKDAELGLSKVSYTAGDPAIFNKTGATHNTPQFTGQSIGETLGFYGIPITKADNDRVNGWGRCHALLRDAPDGKPWCVVHPDCRYLIRSIPNARSDKHDPDDVDTKMDDHALDAWRYGAMSRPSPAVFAKQAQVFPEGTMGHLRMSVHQKPNVRLGSESVRYAS
jgi:hypothetical protein